MMETSEARDNKETAEAKETARAQAADALAAKDLLFACSICLRCANHRTVVSGKGSVFMLCQSNDTPDTWPKYPPQPLQQCRYFCSR